MKNPLSVASAARLKYNGMVYSAEVNGHSNMYGQNDNFKVASYDQTYPKITLVDDVTTWVAGNLSTNVAKISANFNKSLVVNLK